jgi:conjugative transposon TraK protein
MFTQFKNIDTAFQHIKRFSIFLIIGNVLVSCFALYEAYKAVRQSRNQIYILANGKALQAFAGDRKANIPVEARDHIRMFHEAFFTLDPDDKVIEANLGRAMYLADGSAKAQYDNLKESGYYANLIAANISQEIAIDSIQLDVKQYPFYFKCFATEKLIRTTSTSYRSLITEGYLRNVSRSDNNPHGFLIEHWTTVENTDKTLTP